MVPQFQITEANTTQIWLNDPYFRIREAALSSCSGSPLSSSLVTHQASVARKWLWVGLVIPFSYSASEGASQAVSSVTPLDLARGGIPFVCILVALMSCRAKRRPFGLAEWCLTGFLVWALASASWSISSHATLLKAMSLASGYVCLLLLVNLYEDVSHAVRGLMVFVHLFLISTAFEALIFTGRAFDSPQNLPRLSSVFPQTSPDVLAMVCLVGLVAVATNTGPVQFRGRWIRILLAGVYLLELYATRARTALVLGGLLLGLGAFAWARRSAIAVPTIAFCAAAVVILLTVGNAEASTYFYRQQNATVFSTLTGRTVEWSEAVTFWKSSPIVGRGYYSGHREGLELSMLLHPGQAEPSNLDETWLETLVDTGVIGCVLLAAFALSGMARLIRTRRLLPPNVRWSVLVLGVLALPIVSFLNPTIQANISPNFVIWGFLLLSLPPRQTRHSMEGDPKWHSISRTSETSPSSFSGK